MAVIKVWKVR